MTAVLGLRERKKAATRESIARAALELALRQGPDAVTVDAIAAAADVAPRTFFNYFATKEDAILGADPDRGRTLRAMVESRPARETPLAALRAALADSADDLEARGEDWANRSALIQRSSALSGRHVANFAQLERELSEAVRARTGDSTSCQPDLVVATALTAMRLAVQRWQSLASATRPRLVDVIDEVFDQLAAGFPLGRRRS